MSNLEFRVQGTVSWASSAGQKLGSVKSYLTFFTRLTFHPLATRVYAQFSIQSQYVINSLPPSLQIEQDDRAFKRGVKKYFWMRLSTTSGIIWLVVKLI